MRSLLDNAPEGVSYEPSLGFHQGAPGASCRRVQEILLNRLVHPWLMPDLGFRALALRQPFDLVHVHAHPVRLDGLGRTPLVMSEGSSSAVYLRDYLGWDGTRLQRAYARARRVYGALGVHDRLLRLERVDRAYVFSNWARQVNLEHGADPAKLDVVYPGFETPPLPPRPPRETFTFLFVGTDFERKGGFEVLLAFARLAPRHARARLQLVSPDPRRPHPDRAHHGWVSATSRRQALAALDGLWAAGRVLWQPLHARRRLLGETYPGAEAFVMPSHAEGFGFTNVEAMSFALPVVSSTAGAIPEAVRDGQTGLLVPPGDVDALEQAMERLLLEPDLAARLGAAGRADFLARFTVEHMRAGLARVYRQAGEARCAAS